MLGATAVFAFLVSLAGSYAVLLLLLAFLVGFAGNGFSAGIAWNALFAYATGWIGLPSATFFVLFMLTAVCAVWMHRTVVHMLQTGAPELADHFESPGAQEASAR